MPTADAYQPTVMTQYETPAVVGSRNKLGASRTTRPIAVLDVTRDIAYSRP
jgi:hypothetical protein